MAHQCQYFVLYYLPTATGAARIPLAVVLIDSVKRDYSMRFIKNWDRVKLLDRDADVEVIRGICRDVEERIQHEDADEFIRVMEESYSNSICVSDRAAVYAGDDAHQTINELVKQLGMDD
jgi:Protein of unknown function (DUF3037)